MAEGPRAAAGTDAERPQDKVQLLRLWYHENCRVFRDRLVNEEDCGWFDELLQGHMARWDVAFNEVCPSQPILYGDFMSPGSDVKSYELITSESKVRAPGPLTAPHSGPRAWTLREEGQLKDVGKPQASPQPRPSHCRVGTAPWQ